MSTQFKQKEHPLLVIPGPIEVADEVLYANARPSVSHVGPAFIPAFGESIKMMRQVVYTEDAQPFIIAGSGTLGWDQTASNLVEPGEDVLVLNSGYFGDEFALCLETYGAKVDQVVAPVGKAADLNEVREKLKAKKYKLVTFTHVDTSTGVLSDAKAIGQLVRKFSPDTLVVLDGVCSVASEEIRMDEWNIDVIVSASQKGIGCPPGLSLVWASQRAIQVNADRKAPATSYFANWRRWIPIMKAYEAGNAAYFATPPVQLVFALHTSLKAITAGKPTLEERFAKHKEVSARVKKFVEDLGLKQLASEPGYRANGMTTVLFPEGLKATDVLPKLAAKGVVAAGGLHRACAATYFRIGTMGETVVRPERGDVDRLLQAVQEALAEAGYAPAQKA